MSSIAIQRGCEVVTNKYFIPALPINTEDEAVAEAVIKKSAPKKSRRLVTQRELLDMLNSCQVLLGHMVDDGAIEDDIYDKAAMDLSVDILKLFKEIE